MNVAVWSPVTGQAGVTASAIGLSVAMAAREESACLLLDCHCHNQRASDYLWKKEFREWKQYQGSLGMDALFRFFGEPSVTKEQIRGAALSFMEEKLLLIGGSRKTYPQLFYEQLGMHVDKIIETLRPWEGYAVFDVEAGYRKETVELLEQMDQIVVCFPQNPMVIQEYFKQYSFPLSKTFFLLGNYRKESGFNKRNLMSQFRNFHYYNVGQLSYDSRYGDALCRGEGLRFLLRMLGTRHVWKHSTAFSEDLEQLRQQLKQRMEGKTWREE